LTVEQNSESAKLHLSTLPPVSKGLDLTNIVLTHFQKDREVNCNMEDDSEEGAQPSNIDFVSDKFI